MSLIYMGEIMGNDAEDVFWIISGIFKRWELYLQKVIQPLSYIFHSIAHRMHRNLIQIELHRICKSYVNIQRAVINSGLSFYVQTRRYS